MAKLNVINYGKLFKDILADAYKVRSKNKYYYAYRKDANKGNYVYIIINGYKLFKMHQSFCPVDFHILEQIHPGMFSEMKWESMEEVLPKGELIPAKTTSCTIKWQNGSIAEYRMLDGRFTYINSVSTKYLENPEEVTVVEVRTLTRESKSYFPVFVKGTDDSEIFILPVNTGAKEGMRAKTIA